MCLSGGCALNSSANGKIKENLDIEKVFIPYAPGDGGGSIGSALVVLNNKYSIKKFTNLQNPYLGPKYEEKYINRVANEITKQNFNINSFDENDLCNLVAKKISNGKIVGWFQNRIEFGARALGNRSILADPRNPNMRDILNSKIKRRESFRPFAPSIISDKKQEWFDQDYFNKYMEVVLKIKKNKEKIVPAVIHIDKTCRLQSVDKISNPKFYKLIENFFKITNVPILLNTSFNENEPIVNSPEEAVACFLRTNMDDLVLGNNIISRL